MARPIVILMFVVFLSKATFASQPTGPVSNPNPTSGKTSTVASKTAQDLTISWRSLTYKKTVYNPSVSPEYRNSPGTESLSLSSEIQMADPRLLLGIALEPATEKITDRLGNDVEFHQKPSPSRQKYFQDHFLKEWLREANLDRQVELWKQHPERQPTPIEIDGAMRDRADGHIGLLKGHYIGLLAESIYYVDLPFKASDDWVRLTDDVDIRVIQAQNVPGKHYWQIELRPEDTPTSLDLFVGDPLPNRLIVSPVIITRNSSGFSAGGEGRTNGVMKGEGIGRAEGIRFVMAVNPAHAKIPFEFRDVPLTAPS